MTKIVGLAAIDKAIKNIAGIGSNLNERVQETAVAIIEHAAGQGNGDVSRALTLCQTVARMKTLDVRFLVGYFAAFAGTNINLKDGTVNLFARDSKKQRGFRVDEARANNWYDAFDKDGERAPWYQGPDRAPFESNTIADLAANLTAYVKRMAGLLDTKKEAGGKEVPYAKLTKAEREQLDEAFKIINLLAAKLARHEDVHEIVAKTANDQLTEVAVA